MAPAPPNLIMLYIKSFKRGRIWGRPARGAISPLDPRSLQVSSTSVLACWLGIWILNAATAWRCWYWWKRFWYEHEYDKRQSQDKYDDAHHHLRAEILRHRIETSIHSFAIMCGLRTMNSSTPLRLLSRSNYYRMCADRQDAEERQHLLNQQQN